MENEQIIEEIEFYRRDDIEEGTYLSATVRWMDVNDVPFSKKGVIDNIPSFIINKIKEESYDDNLVPPSMNPNMNRASTDAFTEMFL